MPKVIRVYVLRDTRTGLYEAGAGQWVDGKWVGRATATSKGEATEYADDEWREDFPDGLPEGWELVKVSEFAPRESKQG